MEDCIRRHKTGRPTYADHESISLKKNLRGIKGILKQYLRFFKPTYSDICRAMEYAIKDTRMMESGFYEGCAAMVYSYCDPSAVASHAYRTRSHLFVYGEFYYATERAVTLYRLWRGLKFTRDKSKLENVLLLEKMIA